MWRMFEFTKHIVLVLLLGDVIYGVTVDEEAEIDTLYETSFKTFDASDYSLIATIETKRSVVQVCPSWDDCHLSVVEGAAMSYASNEESSVVRVYDVGRLRAEEEDIEEDQDDEEGGDDGDDNESDSDMDDHDDCKYTTKLLTLTFNIVTRGEFPLDRRLTNK